MSIVVTAFMISILCWGSKSEEFDETVLCDYCQALVTAFDDYGLRPEYTISPLDDENIDDKKRATEKLAKGFQDLCLQMKEGTSDAQFCKALAAHDRGYANFAWEYFSYPEYKLHEKDPIIFHPCMLHSFCKVPKEKPNQ